jgi:hypothetical protein
MPMQFRRMVGVPLFERPWTVEDVPLGQLRADAKAALAKFYEWNETSFWPREEFAPKAPEEVRMVGENGEVMLLYDLQMLMAETGHSRAAYRYPPALKPEDAPPM